MAILPPQELAVLPERGGAEIGDMFMRLTHTAELNHVDPFDYLVELQRHAAEIHKSPAQWLPWSYRDTLAATSVTDPPS